MPFPYVALAHLGAKPLEPFGKGSNALKAGTPDAGPEGPTLSGALGETCALSETWSSVQSPARVERNGALYARPARKGKAIEAMLFRVCGKAWWAPGSARRAAPPVRRLRGSACRRVRWQRGLYAASLCRRVAPPCSGLEAPAGMPDRSARGRARL